MKSVLPHFITVLILLSFPKVSFEQTAPNLGTTSCFALFTAVGAFDNTGATTITGNIGSNTASVTGFPPGVITGTIYNPPNATTAQAATDVNTAYNYLSTLSGTTIGATLDGQTIPSGVHSTGSGAATLNGTLTLDGGGNPNALFIIQIGGDLTVAPSSTVILTNSASLSNVYWQINGEFDLGAGSVFVGTVVANGAINLLAGSSLSGRGLSKAGAITLNDNAVNSGIRWSWTGGTSTNWSVPSNWCTDAVPTSIENVEIPSVTTYSPTVDNAYPLNSAPATCNELTIESGASLTIGAGNALTLSSNFTNNGTFTIESSATSEGSFIDNGTIKGSGTYNIQRWVSDNGGQRWEYISSPVSVASSSIFTSSLHGLWYGDEPTNTWISILNSSPQNMTVMKGYARSYQTIAVGGAGNGDGNVANDFIGTPNTGSQSINVTRTETAPYTRHGWNLVGNPYPSAIDWNATSVWTKTNVSNAIYFRHNGTVCCYIDGIGTGSPAATNIIPPMQSFWVKVDTLQTSGTLACTNGVRLHNATPLYKINTIQDNTLHIIVANDTNSRLSDDTYLRFRSYATDGFDSQYDAFKMFAEDSAYPQVYTNITGNGDISINTMSALSSSARIIPLGFDTYKAGQFTLTAGLVSSFTDNGNTVFLKDLQTGVYQNLSTDSTYQFTTGATSGLNRFLLYFNNTSGITENIKSMVQIYAYNNEIYIKGINMLNGDATVYDILGQVVAIKHLTGITTGVINLQPNSAFYIVKYTTSDRTITKRVFINQ